MNSRSLRIALRVFSAMLAVAVVAVAGLIVSELIGLPGTQAPRTEGERVVMVAEGAVRAEPDSAEARSNLAAAYLSVGRVSSALREAEYATRLDPEHGSGHLVTGMAQRQMGRYEAAIASIEKALANSEAKMADWFIVAYTELAQSYEGDDDLAGAIAALDSAIGFFPEGADLYYERARILELTGELEKALADYEAVLTFIPDDRRAQEAVERLKGQVDRSSAQPTESSEGAQE